MTKKRKKRRKTTRGDRTEHVGLTLKTTSAPMPTKNSIASQLWLREADMAGVWPDWRQDGSVTKKEEEEGEGEEENVELQAEESSEDDNSGSEE